MGAAACSEWDGSPEAQAVGPAAGSSAARAQETAEPAHAAQHEAADGEGPPLLPIMMQMAADMRGLLQALWLEDYEQMSARAASVVGHAGISAEERERIEAALGPEMAAFEAADEAVHQASLRMHEAAEARKLDAFVEQLAEVQRGCVGCHSRFRERLRTR